MTITTIIIISFWLVFITFLFGQGRIMRYFNLIDKRNLVGSKDSYQKLNKLMSVGDVSLYRYEYMSDPMVTFRGTYQTSKTESSEIRIQGKSFDKVIKDAYNVVKQKGLIKE